MKYKISAAIPSDTNLCIKLFTRRNNFIKDLAPLPGFEWSVDKAGGANSLRKYKQATTAKSQEKEDEAIAWLDSYNRDDVRATFAVRNYIRGLSL